MYSGRTTANLEIKTLSEDAKRTNDLIRYKKRERGRKNKRIPLAQRKIESLLCAIIEGSGGRSI